MIEILQSYQCALFRFHYFSEGKEGDRAILDQEYECVPKCFFTVLVNIVNLIEQRDAQEIIRHISVCLHEGISWEDWSVGEQLDVERPRWATSGLVE